MQTIEGVLRDCILVKLVNIYQNVEQRITIITV